MTLSGILFVKSFEMEAVQMVELHHCTIHTKSKWIAVLVTWMTATHVISRDVQWEISVGSWELLQLKQIQILTKPIPSMMKICFLLENTLVSWINVYYILFKLAHASTIISNNIIHDSPDGRFSELQWSVRLSYLWQISLSKSISSLSMVTGLKSYSCGNQWLFPQSTIQHTIIDGRSTDSCFTLIWPLQCGVLMVDVEWQASLYLPQVKHLWF